MKKSLMAFAFWAAASAASAAPFCVATAYGENCWYYNKNDCEREAQRANGACVLNQAEMEQRQQSQSRSGAPFCVVTSYGNNCWYYDADQCKREAARQNGVCAYNR